MHDDERQFLLTKYAEVHSQLTRASVQWFAIGIVAGIGIWEGVRWVVGWVVKS